MTVADAEKRDMKIVRVVVFSFGIAAGSFGTAHAADLFCPASAAPIAAYSAVAKKSPIDVNAVLIVARSAESVYAQCAIEALDNGEIEPRMHYTQVRQSQFAFVAARALASLGRIDEAKKELESSRRFAVEVAEWLASTAKITADNKSQSVSHVETGNGLSEYHDLAVNIRDADDAFLKKLATATAPVPSATP